MPADLKQRLAEEVERSGSSLNDVAVGILAARFAIPFVPSGRGGRAPGASGSVLLRMPAELKDKLAARAAQRKRNVNDMIIETLAGRVRKVRLGPTTAEPPATGAKGRAARLRGRHSVNLLLPR